MVQYRFWAMLLPALTELPDMKLGLNMMKISFYRSVMAFGALAALCGGAVAAESSAFDLLKPERFSQAQPQQQAQAQVPAAPAQPAAVPPVGAEPQTTTASFGDWVLTCQRLGDATTPRRCEVGQVIQVQGKGPIAKVFFAVMAPKTPVAVSILLPNNVTFPSVVRFSVDEKDKDVVELPWSRCLPVGCLATTPMKDDILKKWRPLLNQGRIAFNDGEGHEITLPFSFRGLSQALDAMAKG